MALPSLPSDVVEKLWKKIPFVQKATFVAAFLFGLVSHGYMFANKLPNHDELGLLVDYNDTWYLGRWFLRVPSAISSVFSLPWLNGLLSLLYIAIAACLIVACLRITDTLCAVLISGIMASFPVVTSVFTYMYTADAYFFALMLAALSVYLARRYKYGFLCAIIPLTLSLGCYQAYFSVAAGLFVLVLVMDILGGVLRPVEIIKRGASYLAALLISLGGYMLIARLTISLRGGEFADYMGISEMGQISLADIPRLIGEAYHGVFTFFFTRGDYAQHYYNIHHRFLLPAFVLLLLACLVLLVRRGVLLKLGKDVKRLSLLLLLLIVFPLGFNVVFLMNSAIRHLLMLYGMTLFLIFPIAVYSSTLAWEQLPRSGKNQSPKLTRGLVSISAWIVVGVVALSIFNYVTLANKAYLKMTIGYEQAYAQSVSLVTRIQQAEGYRHEMEVVLVGLPYRGMNDYVSNQKGFDTFEVLGAYNEGLFGEMYTYGLFLRDYLGLRRGVALFREERITDGAAMAALTDMPQYPNPGSIRVVGEKVYVKFSYDPANPVGELFY